jgi:hypothetical protein
MRIFIALAAITVFVLSACSTVEPLTGVGDIRGTKWRLQAFDSPENGRVTIPANGPEYSFLFLDGKNVVEGQWNCNGIYNARYTLQLPNSIKIDSAIITNVGCDDTSFDRKMRSNDGRQSVGNWLFGKNCTYNSDENRLRIWYDNGTKSADFVRVK